MRENAIFVDTKPPFGRITSKLNLKYNAMLTAEDRKQLEEKGISESQLNEQLACFRSGFPYLKLSAPASVEKGILQLSGETASYEAVWEQYVGEGHKVVKFVPASGAASRMFKNMFAFLQAEYDEPTTDFEKKFFAEVHRFAFSRKSTVSRSSTTSTQRASACMGNMWMSLSPQERSNPLWPHCSKRTA